MGKDLLEGSQFFRQVACTVSESSNVRHFWSPVVPQGICASHWDILASLLISRSLLSLHLRSHSRCSPAQSSIIRCGSLLGSSAICGVGAGCFCPENLSFFPMDSWVDEHMGPLAPVGIFTISLDDSIFNPLLNYTEFLLFFLFFCSLWNILPFSGPGCHEVSGSLWGNFCIWVNF